MGRPSKIQPAIIKVLSESKDPLRFTQIKEEVETTLKRPNLDDSQLNYNLKKLTNSGLVETVLVDNKKNYILITNFYEQSLKNSLTKMITDRSISQMYDLLEGEEKTPTLVFMEPPAYNYQSKTPIQNLDYYNRYNMFGGGTMEDGDIRIQPNWSDPTSAISSVMLNDFWGLLSKNQQNNIAKLVTYAYWLGVRHYIENDTIFSLTKSIEDNRKVSNKIIQSNTQDSNLVKTEQLSIEIFDLVEKLIQKDNLQEYLSFLISNKKKYDLLMGEIRSLEGTLSRRDLFYPTFLDFGRMVIDGFTVSNLLKTDQRNNRLPLKHRYFLSSKDIWGSFFNHIIVYPNPSDDNFDYHCYSDIKGTQDEICQIIRKYKLDFDALIDLPFKRKMVFCYLWGFPETVHLTQIGNIRNFDSWLDALIKGYLDHRNWLFTEKTVDKLELAIRNVKRHKEPKDIRIDKEPWSLLDLYRYHPFGKTEDFWENIVNIINEKRSSIRNIYSGGDLPESIYMEFNRLETNAISKMLDEEEERYNH